MLTNDQVLGKGRYRIISSYSQDESGGLYEAYDTVSNANVVLRESGGTGKVMTATQLDELNTAFAGEAKALSEIRHESLLSVQDYFSEGWTLPQSAHSQSGTAASENSAPNRKKGRKPFSKNGRCAGSRAL